MLQPAPTTSIILIAFDHSENPDGLDNYDY